MKYALTLAGGLLAGFLWAEAPAVTKADPVRLPVLIEQLGSPRYKEREKAAAELVRMGRGAKIALLEGVKSNDPEVSSRCQQLLPQALTLDLLYRIDLFLKDTEGKEKHDLPLWKLFQEKIGGDNDSRKLFAEMLKTNAALLEVIEEQPNKATERIQHRSNEMYQEMFGNPFGGFRGGYRPNALNPAELACVLFACSTPAYKPTQPDWMLSNLYNQPQFTNLLKDEKTGVGYRKVFFNYLDGRMDDNTINQCVWMLAQHNIKSAADVVAKALKDGKATQIYTKASAICCVGTLGNKTNIPNLEPFLKETNQIQGFVIGGNRGEVKLQDVALANIIHLSGKNPKDYGFKMWNVYPNQLIQYHQLGFSSEDDRKAAFKKWTDENKK
ncbi:hypothetical protein [Zavarzinella formosa]|uniref:hypothetical protein n=1 Tax=Zavarzinella formosa TaxID=360055 RepID=UPI00030BCBAF|nr:hypothetical protein [Zavarzinella formosa]